MESKVIERLNGKTVPYFTALRPADEEECRAAGLTPHDALSQSIRMSTQSFAVMVGDEVMAFWGWAAPSLLGAHCHAWMLTTPEANKHRTYIARESKRILRAMLALYPIILIIVDRKHVVAIRWLQWLGFHPTERHGRFIEMRVHRGTAPWEF